MAVTLLSFSWSLGLGQEVTLISTEGHVGRPCGFIQIKPNSNLPGPKKMQHAALVAVSNQAGSGKSSAAVTCWSSAVEELGPSGASGSNALLLPAAVYSRPLWRAPLTSESDALIAEDSLLNIRGIFRR